jgi:threonine dehydratase
MSPGCSIVGVEPEAGNDGQQSLAKGEVVSIPIPRSIADGALTPSLGEYTFPIIRDTVERIVTVTDAQLVSTLRFFAERMKIVVEPTGCLAAAAILSGVLDCKGKRVGIVLSGGNVDLAALAGFLT